MFVPIEQPLDLSNTLTSGQAFRWRPDGEWFEGVVFANIVRLRRRPGGIELRCAPDDEALIAPLLGDYLGLRDDLEAIYASIATDDLIKAAIARYRGMRVLRQEPWECLISFICSPVSNVPRISRNVEDICENFGRRITMGDRVRSRFPTPEELAEAGEKRLRGLGLGFRAASVAAAARSVADGQIDLVPLRESSYDEALDALTALVGVGDKVANCVLLFSLDKPEAFPVDVHVSNVLRESYLRGSEAKISTKAMRLWAQEHFGRYAGYANQYLFHGRRQLRINAGRT